MPRKNDEHEPELEGIAERLRAERPEASPLELDQIKLSAMSRAKATVGRANPRRLVVAALTVGLVAAGTGGVLAAGGTGSPAGNAAQAQYSSTTIACGNDNGNGNGNGNTGEGNGNENGNGNGNFNCNNNSFNNDNNTSSTTNNNTTDVTNNYNNSTVTISGTQSVGTGAGGVQASKTVKNSGRKLKIHVKLPRKGGKLRRVSVSVNGKHLKTITGKKASANIVLANLPCGSGATTVTVTLTLSNGKTITSSHTYHLCT
jgi:hypothetical protein